MKKIPKYVFKTDQREAAPMVWNVKMFICEYRGRSVPRYSLMLRFTTPERHLDDLVRDLSHCKVEVPEGFLVLENTKTRVKIGEGI